MEINMDNLLRDLPIRSSLLYHTSVMFQDEDYKAFMFLHVESIQFVAIKLDQTDRVRNYSCRYDELVKVTTHDEPHRHILSLYTKEQSEGESSFEIIFTKGLERNVYANRIRMLMRLYKEKGPKNRNNEVAIEDSGRQQVADEIKQASTIVNRQSGSPDESTNELRESCLNDISERQKDQTSPKLGVDIFSPENLKRLAAASSQEPICDLSIDPPVPICDDVSSFDATGHINDDGYLTFPIEIKVPGTEALVASAKMKMELTIDREAFKLAKKIEDRNERVQKIRELIQLDVGNCQLVLS